MYCGGCQSIVSLLWSFCFGLYPSYLVGNASGFSGGDAAVVGIRIIYGFDWKASLYAAGRHRQL